LLDLLGAGKTTLLNFLSGREISKNLSKTGNIYINGVEKDKIKNFAQISAYVQQDDILFQTMTVRECLEFAAKLKLKGTLESKISRVNDLITELRLNKCQNTKIGGPLVKGVSGGERKRCSIGVELITDPTLIFLDEPTTGLDSFTAQSVMETLKDLAMTGRTVISTIHQPNSDIFEAFDRLMLMAQGKIIFFNEARLAVDYFTGINYRCPEMSNPADYFMSMMSIESAQQEEVEEDEDNSKKKSQQEILEEYTKKIAFFSSNY
jgi:ABC-type multidrug transport system ATPase subunit